VLFVLVSHDAMLRIISQATGHYRQRNELGYFSAFVELNRKIHNFLDVEDVLVLVNDALRHHIQVRQIRYLLARDVPTRQQETVEETEDGLELRSWGEGRGGAFHDARFEAEVKARARVMSFADALPAVQAAFGETGTNLLLPIMQNQRLLGVLLLGRSDNRIPYTEFECQMFDYLANQLSIIIDRIRVYAKVLQKTAMDHAEKMQVMQSLSANIAHEMRTPLAGIRGSISGLEEYLPQLLESHDYGVQQAPQRFSPIREGHLQKLRATPRRIMLMIDQANTVIDMLLVNLKGNSPERRQLDVVRAAAIVEQAVDRYPFRSGERERIHLDLEQDFSFLGVESFFVYVLFNLLKNALYSLQSAQKGEITIRLQRGSDFNRLYFRDTGGGVDPAILGRIFDGFFTTKSDGTGAGLAFCRRTILSFGGEIDCHSMLGEYAEFIIKLPLFERHG
ncbi:MAG TPA: HAMP domain-containing sensor histidine kinase, partial [Hyphomicrobiales bacterium]|nr:HAMP domain-containing sensor histidine kinase [Hyphomicrobiales bacterium]